jgi:acetolactate synthase small subunit
MKVKFVIAARNRADVLPRVVLLFHRSAVDIESIHMPVRKKKASELTLTITVDGKLPNAHRMAVILEKLVDVLSVETILRGPKHGLL